MHLNELVQKAQDGNKKSLQAIIIEVQDDIYYLSLRMLCHPEHAKDATQEILILIITQLSTFKFNSRFQTWVYRVAANYLINNKKQLDKDPGLSFDEFKKDLEVDLQEPEEITKQAEYPVLLNEVRVMCTTAMLLCLDQKHRMAYILGDILELDHSEASECLSITKAGYRQQLSRARNKVVNFTSESCGLANQSAKCSCEKKLKGAIHRERVNSDQLYFSHHAKLSYVDLQQKIAEMSRDLKTLTLQRSFARVKSPDNFISLVEDMFTDQFETNKLK